MPGGILANAYPLPDGWENGIAFLGGGCSQPLIAAPCTVIDGVDLTRPGAKEVFEPVYINQSAACSMLSKVGVVDLAANRLEGTTEWALGQTLQEGYESSNPSFQDAILVGTGGASVVAAVACLEAAAAATGYGAEIFLHAPIRAAAYLASEHLIDNGLSPSGFRWVFSSGYTATDTLVTIWATGSLFASVSEAETLIDPSTGAPPVGWRVNTNAAIRQRLGMAAFDPCLNLSATFIVPTCTGG